nr:hypothetical protein [Tanacetum cinerariifolium]
MENVYEAKVSICRRFSMLENNKIMFGNDLRVHMFKDTCFGDWLDVDIANHEPTLVHGILSLYLPICSLTK